MWVMLGLPVMLGVSMLSRKWALRLALAGTLLFMLLLALVPFIGKEANGAHRWIGAGAFLIQPSEFLKPLFIVDRKHVVKGKGVSVRVDPGGCRTMNKTKITQKASN